MAIGVTSVGGAFVHIAAGATTVIATQSVDFKRLVVNNPGTTITATLYDGVNASAPVIAVVALAAGMSLAYDLQTANGLTVVTSGTCDITITTGGG